ncbi:DUF58 domain-containing protein [Thermogladius sp. 4427co]|uniref:DUF58 domain-containing protein n=1 Tax=Thermogladius sp. 4427co TaxID=3450718 RepID=UPI003F7910BD
MSVKTDRIFYILSLILQVIAVESILLIDRNIVGGLAGLAILAFSIFYSRFTCYSNFAVSLIPQNINPASLLVKILLPALSALMVKTHPSERLTGFEKTLVYAFVFTPLYIILPTSLIPLLSLLGFSLTRYGAIVSSLARTRIEIGLEPEVARLGDNVRLHIRAQARGRFWYEVFIDNIPVATGFSQGVYEYSYTIRTHHIGIRNVNVRVRLCDEDKFACYTTPEYRPRFKTVPAYQLLVAKAESVLRRLLREIPSPVIMIRGRQDSSSSTGIGYGERGRALTGYLSATGGGVYGTSASTGTGGLYHTVEENSIGGSDIEGSAGPGFEHIYGWMPAYYIYAIIRQIARTLLYGDYKGSRDYFPGDPVRNIHWKKSASRGKLVIKEYSGSGSGGSGESGEVFIIADWLASSYEELDKLVSATINILIYMAENTGDSYLYLVTPGSREYFVVGRPVEVLASLLAIMRSEDIKLGWDYKPLRNEYIPVADRLYGGDGSRLIAFFRDVNIAECQRVYDELRNMGLHEKIPYVVINGSPTMLKYDFMKQYIEARGHPVHKRVADLVARG